MLGEHRLGVCLSLLAVFLVRAATGKYLFVLNFGKMKVAFSTFHIAEDGIVWCSV